MSSIPLRSPDQIRYLLRADQTRTIARMECLIDSALALLRKMPPTFTHDGQTYSIAGVCDLFLDAVELS